MQNLYNANMRINYEYKTAEEKNDFLYNQYDAQKQIELANQEKLAKFKDRIKAFNNIKTLSEAKELAQKILPTAKEISRFNIGSAKCTIINKENNFRICINSPEEFISYDFI